MFAVCTLPSLVVATCLSPSLVVATWRLVFTLAAAYSALVSVPSLVPLGFIDSALVALVSNCSYTALLKLKFSRDHIILQFLKIWFIFVSAGCP